jgi:hypothetical protein
MTERPRVPLDGWILAGQSNMEGAGLLADPRVGPGLAPDPRVWALTSAGDWAIAEEPLHRGWESYTPVHHLIRRPTLSAADRLLPSEELATRDRLHRSVGSGLGISFATAVSDATGRGIALLPTAHGGTSLDQWSGEHASLGGRSLFGSMLHRLLRARQNADFSLKGILWYQGEADAQPGDAETYVERMVEWIAAARLHTASPDLPVLVVQLGRVVTSPDLPPGTWDAHSWDLVRESQRMLPSLVSNVRLTSAIDLGLVDVIHIDTPGLQRLGRRLARLATSGGAGPNLVRLERGPSTANGLPTFRVVCEGVTGHWKPGSNIRGFDVCTGAGTPHPTISVVNAYPDPAEPAEIVIVLSGDDAQLQLAHGLGLDPHCLVVDEGDMPLPAFAPRQPSPS